MTFLEGLMSLEGAGALFGLFDPFKRVYDYVQGVRESREVKKQLDGMLVSLRTFETSALASKESGTAMVDKVLGLDPPITALEMEELMRLSIQFYGHFQIFLCSICQFGQECNDLVSGDFEGFLTKVKNRKPDVHDIITFFGNNYDSKTETLDLTRLPALMRLYGKKGAWKESTEISQAVADGRKKVDKAMDIVERVRKQPKIHIRDRQLIIHYFGAFRRLGREGARFHSNRETLKALKENAPSWYIDFIEITDEVRKGLPGGSRFPPFTGKSRPQRTGSWPER